MKLLLMRPSKKDTEEQASNRGILRSAVRDT